MPFELLQVDAFTCQPFQGNPAAVVLLGAAAPERGWLAAVAAEMNLSETAFVAPPAEAGAPWGLRWFTPRVEVDLCGHATLAAAHVLWETGRAESGAAVRFATRSGELSAAPLGEGWIELDLPALGAAPASAPAGLLDALGLPAAAVTWTGRSRFDLLVATVEPAVVAGLAPELGALARLDARGVCVTAPGGADGLGGDGSSGVDFVSRFFAPAVGVPEDPVTGSAHCMLGPYWAEQLGRPQLLARQVSARGGELRVAVRGDRVGVAGQAVTVVRGVLEG
ncbi:MAG: PhzF family phenazine biosynthesis protein [Acidimicrobiales bacterium]